MHWPLLCASAMPRRGMVSYDNARMAANGTGFARQSLGVPDHGAHAAMCELTWSPHRANAPNQMRMSPKHGDSAKR